MTAFIITCGLAKSRLFLKYNFYLAHFASHEFPFKRLLPVVQESKEIICGILYIGIIIYHSKIHVFKIVFFSSELLTLLQVRLIAMPDQQSFNSDQQYREDYILSPWSHEFVVKHRPLRKSIFLPSFMHYSYLVSFHERAITCSTLKIQENAPFKDFEIIIWTLVHHS